MPVVLCPRLECHRKVTVSDAALGGSVRCPYCSQVFRVAAKVEASPSLSTAAPALATNAPAPTLDDTAPVGPSAGTPAIPSATLTGITPVVPPGQAVPPPSSAEAGQTLTDFARVTPTPPCAPAAATLPPAGATATVALAEPPAAVGLAAEDPLPSRLGRFEVRQRLGEGAFGIVYRAYDPQLDREVALKVAKPHTLNTEQRVKRFLREAKAAGNLRHPNIVPVHDSGRDGEHYYIASVFIAGKSLAAALEEQSDHGLDARRAASIVRRLAEALAYAHQRGVVHRDVKPANVMLDEQGEPLLMDFGLAARSEGEEKLTQEAVAMGTPAYMAPEQALGQATAASDQYSLGCTLYELLTGRTPFAGPPEIQIALHQSQEPPSPRKHVRRVPQDLETICLKTLAKPAAERYRDCQELADDLRRYLEGEPTHARPPGLGERVWKWTKRRPGAAAALVTIMLLLVGLAVGGVRYTADVRQHNIDLQKAYDTVTLAEKDARDQRDDATKSRDRMQVALDRSRRNVFALQLSVVSNLCETDPRLGVQLLEDAARCPEDLRDFTWGLYYHLCQRDRVTFKGQALLQCVAFAPDGRTVASGDEEGRVQLWDPTGTRPPVTIQGHKGPVTAVAFVPDGKALASAGEDTFVKLWSVPDGKALKTLKGHQRPIHALAFSPKTKLLASCSGERNRGGEVFVWDVTRGEAVISEGDAGYIPCIAFSPDDKTLAVGSDPGHVITYDWSEGRDWHHLGKHAFRTFGLAFSPDGKTLASASQDTTIKLWDLTTHKERLTLTGHHGFVTAVAFAPDGKRLASAGQDGTIRLWDPSDGRECTVMGGHRGQITGIAFGPAGQWIASSSLDRTLKLWSTAGVQETAAFPGKIPIYTGTVTPDSKTLVVAGEDGVVRAQDIASGRLRKTFRGHAGRIHAVAASTDGRYIASAGDDATIRLWELSSGKSLQTFKGHDNPVTRVAFLPDAKTVVSASEDGTWRVWEAATGKSLFSVDAEQTRLLALALSPDGRTAATGGEDGTIKLWDLAERRLLGLSGKEADGHKEPVRSLAFSQNGGTLASGCRDGTVKLWNVAQRTLRLTLPGHQDQVYAVAFSRDGLTSKTLATASHDGVVKLWDASSGQVLGTFHCHREGIWCLAFAPDRSVLITAGDAGTIKCWRAAAAPTARPED
jgi:WD40 repeat protein/tRNA A-37 threonylcarbamoyl transferase component Bud32